MSDLILVLNCGSSSIKFALFDASAATLARQPLCSGKVDGITGAAPTFGETGSAPGPVALDAAHPYRAALEYIRTRVLARLGAGGHRLVAVAHRVVHGGAKYFDPVRVDAAVLADLQRFIPLAPLHQPFALEAIEALLDTAPGLPQVACFDTAFHHTLPDVEKMLPLSWDAWQRGLRRYGFHGLSYEYLSIALPERYGDAARGRTLVAHLGSGASLCALQGLQSVATTMGFSALDGLMMGTRCGALDPGAVLYLLQNDQLSPEQVGQLLYHQSGLLGLSGVSSDPRALLPLEAGNARVQAALALYVRRMVREMGALVAVLGGLDMLVFTAGIGEHNAAIRERVCQGLAYLGVALDADANARHAHRISSAASRVTVAVEPTNEEWIAACAAHRLVAPRVGDNVPAPLLSAPTMYTQILVAVDGSPTCDQAVAHAAALAKATGARVRLLHVIDPIAHISGFERPEVYSQQVLPALQKNAQAVLARAQEQVARQGVPVDTALVQNLDARVSQLVIAHAKEWGAQLIVLGTQGRRGLQRLMLGSDAEDIARTAPVPVLLVRLPPDPVDSPGAAPIHH